MFSSPFLPEAPATGLGPPTGAGQCNRICIWPPLEWAVQPLGLVSGPWHGGWPSDGLQGRAYWGGYTSPRLLGELQMVAQLH